MTDNARRILKAWAVTLVVSFLMVFVLAILMAEPDPATRDGTSTESMATWVG